MFGSGRFEDLDGGIEQVCEDVGCADGTAILVRDLFYNTPARRKFVKSDRAEGAACVNAALRCALGRPDVSVRMYRDNEEVFFSPGDGLPKSAVYALLGRDVAKDLLECSGEGEDGIRVQGFVSAPHAGRGSRSLQFFFVNGRAFRSTTLQAALEQAYKNSLLTGRFPACVLYLTLSLGKVDVNVHPTKSEVRFSEEKKVFDAVYYAVLSALRSQSPEATAEIRLSSTTQRVVGSPPNPDFFKKMTSTEFRASVAQQAETPPVQMRISIPPQQEQFLPSPAVTKARTNEAPIRLDSPSPSADLAPSNIEDKPLVEKLSDLPDYRIIGETMDTYILVETTGALLLIDKHACHERILFDRLQAGLGPQMQQALLTPVTFSPGADDAELLEQNRSLLEEAGFIIDRFGEDGVIVRAVPADVQGDELALLEELTAALRAGKPEDRREVLCHTIACKAAIKAGSRSDPAELDALVRRVISGEIRYCPHGRPVCVKLTKPELDRHFRRIV